MSTKTISVRFSDSTARLRIWTCPLEEQVRFAHTVHRLLHMLTCLVRSWYQPWLGLHPIHGRGRRRERHCTHARGSARRCCDQRLDCASTPQDLSSSPGGSPRPRPAVWPEIWRSGRCVWRSRCWAWWSLSTRPDRHRPEPIRPSFGHLPTALRFSDSIALSAPGPGRQRRQPEIPLSLSVVLVEVSIPQQVTCRPRPQLEAQPWKRQTPRRPRCPRDAEKC